MILTCPSCDTRYLLPASSIKAAGRTVRCAKCQHEWFEAGDEEVITDHGFDNSDDMAPDLNEEPIPDSVKPLPHGSNVPAYAEDVLRAEVSMQGRITGYAAAAAVFIVLILGGFLYKDKVVTAWPPAAMIYELASSPVELAGEGLIVETLSASTLKDVEGQDVLVVKGRVVNLTNHAIAVPSMKAVMRSTNGEDGIGWLIETPADEVAAGASFVFTSDYPNVPRGVGAVNLSFVPTVGGVQLAVLKQDIAAEEAPAAEPVTTEPAHEEAVPAPTQP